MEFRDDALAAGLNFVQENGGATGKLIPPVTASGGVGLLDFNNDGWLDVYFVQGGAFPRTQNRVRPPRAIASSGIAATEASRMSPRPRAWTHSRADTVTASPSVISTTMDGPTCS